jgi:general secretion pathway protein D
MNLLFPRQLLAVLAMTTALTGCGLFQPIRSDHAGSVASQAIEEKDAELDALYESNREALRNKDKAVMETPAREGSGVVGEMDVDQMLAKSRGGEGKARGKATAVKLEFEDTSLRDVITVFMKDYLKKPYTFKDTFKDRKVNLFFDAQATREDLIDMFDTLLENYGVRLHYSGGVYLIGSSEDKADSMQQPSPLGIGDAVGVVRLKYIDAKDFHALAKQVTKNPEKISVLPGNLLVVNSTSTDLRAVRTLLDEIDVPAFSGKYILIYAPRYLAASSLLAVMDSTQTQLLGTPGASKQFEAKQLGESERIVIVAANRSARDLVLQLLAQIDVVDANHRRIFQYTLGLQAAADIAANLGTLIKSAIKGANEIAVTPDKMSNSLFIYASPQEYAEIRKLLTSMDYRPPAVQIDMVIAEVTLNEEMRYGVEWYLKKTGLSLVDATTSLGIPTGITPNFAASLVNATNNYATLQLLGSQTSFSLLSNPKIVVRNGATAHINVGQEEPVIKQKTTVSGTAGSTVIEPEFKKIGLELEVTPTVSANNEVRMIIKLKDTSITGVKSLGTDTYPILANREILTDLVTADGHTIFLGGIRKQSGTDTAAKIPGLGDLQGAGALFRNKDTINYGSELIILATPTVMLDQQGADIVTRAVLRAAQKDFNYFKSSGKVAQENRPVEQIQLHLNSDQNLHEPLAKENPPKKETQQSAVAAENQPVEQVQQPTAAQAQPVPAVLPPATNP